MRNGFLRGSAGQLATASVVIVAVISAAIWCTIWRYESASNSSLVALNAISVSRDTYALEIHFQDEKDAATKYALVPSPAFRQANVAAWYECFGALRLFDDWLKLVQPLVTIRATLHS